jgi:membrane protein implicated in regulation of membrane protease activity
VNVLIAWVVLAVVLVVIELRHLAFYSIFVAAGALAAAGVAAFAPSAVPLQVLTAVIVAAAGIMLVRPRVAPKLHRHTAGSHVAKGVHGGLVGQEVLTLDAVGDAVHPGHVRLAGERWLAVSGDNRPIDAGVRVLVMEVQGTTLVVYPVDGRQLNGSGEHEPGRAGDNGDFEERS